MPRSPGWILVGLTLVSLSLPACPKETKPPDERVDRDAGEDTVDRSPTAVEFELVNSTGSAIYVQTQDQGCSSRPGWVGVRRSAESWQLWSACSNCECSDVENGECRPGPCTGECSIAEVQEVATGENLRLDWRGKYWRESQRQGTSCDVEAVPESGAELNVEFCWGTGKQDADGPGPGKTVDMETCATESFEYGAERVRHTVE